MSDTTRAKKVQETFRASAHKIWLAGLGALATGQEEGSRLFSTLVERGTSFEASGRHHVEKAKDAMADAKKIAENYWETLGQTLEEKLTDVMRRTGVPTKQEIEILSQRVDKLTAAIEKLQKASASPARPQVRRRKTTAKKEPSKTDTKATAAE